MFELTSDIDTAIKSPCRSDGKSNGLVRLNSHEQSRSATAAAGAARKDTDVQKAPEVNAQSLHDEIGRKLRFEYQYGHNDETEKVLKKVQTLCSNLLRSRISTRELLQEAAQVMYHDLRIREVSIGLRSHSDNLYRYVLMAGMRPEVWESHKGLTYTYSDFFDNGRWKGTNVSIQSRLMLAEDEPYADGEEGTFDRRMSQKNKRKSLDESIEGDYIDVQIRGLNNDLVGWIELSGTWDGKIPTPRTIKWVELIADLIGTAIAMNDLKGTSTNSGTLTNGDL